MSRGRRTAVLVAAVAVLVVAVVGVVILRSGPDNPVDERVTLGHRLEPAAGADGPTLARRRVATVDFPRGAVETQGIVVDADGATVRTREVLDADRTGWTLERRGKHVGVVRVAADEGVVAILYADGWLTVHGLADGAPRWRQRLTELVFGFGSTVLLSVVGPRQVVATEERADGGGWHVAGPDAVRRVARPTECKYATAAYHGELRVYLLASFCGEANDSVVRAFSPAGTALWSARLPNSDRDIAVNGTGGLITLDQVTSTLHQVDAVGHASTLTITLVRPQTALHLFGAGSDAYVVSVARRYLNANRLAARVGPDGRFVWLARLPYGVDTTSVGSTDQRVFDVEEIGGSSEPVPAGYQRGCDLVTRSWADGTELARLRLETNGFPCPQVYGPLGDAVILIDSGSDPLARAGWHLRVYAA